MFTVIDQTNGRILREGYESIKGARIAAGRLKDPNAQVVPESSVPKIQSQKMPNPVTDELLNSVTGRSVLVVENFIFDDDYHSDLNRVQTYHLDARKILEWYRGYFERAYRPYLGDYGYTTLRPMIRHSALRMKSDLLEENDPHYTREQITLIAEMIIDGDTKVSTSSSKKYSFDDTDWEVDLFKAEDEHAAWTLDVQVNY